MFGYVYILASKKDGTLYTGVTAATLTAIQMRPTSKGLQLLSGSGPP
ncbi:MAG: hypothetical protein WDZ83_06575 [Rhizobiaceae bacterium]